MKKLLLALALSLLPSIAMAQCNGQFANGQVCGVASSGPKVPGAVPFANFNGFITQLIATNTSAPSSAAGQTVVEGTLPAQNLTSTGQAWFYNALTSGAVIQGNGSAVDFTLLNKSGATVCNVTTGTTTYTCNGLSLTNGLTNANLAQMLANTVKCNPTGSTANAQDCTGQPQITAATYGASGSAQNTTATCTASSTSVTLSAAIDFKNTQGIALEHCGSAFSASPPTSLAVTPQGTTGSTTYAYQIASIDDNGGVGAAVTAVTITTGNATLGSISQTGRSIAYNQITWTSGSGAAGVAVWRSTSGGAYVLIGIFGSGGNIVYDVGIATQTIPWVPATPTVSALNDRFISTIASGAGTTSIVLAAAATNSTSGAYTRHDDTASINAYAAAQTSLFFPPGTYNTEEITVPSTVQSIQCSSPSATILQGWNASSNQITANSMPLGFRFDGCSVEPIASGNVVAFRLTSSTEPIVSNSRFGGVLAVVSISNLRLRFVHNVIDNWYIIGLFDQTSTNSNIADNTILPSGFPPTGQGIEIVGGAGPLIIGNRIEGSTTFGIDDNGASQAKITGNIVLNSLHEGIHVSSNNAAIADYQISDNLVYSGASIDYCISVSNDNTAHNIGAGKVSGNILYGCGVAGIGIAGFGVGATTIVNTEISNNYVLVANTNQPAAPINCDIELNGTEVQQVYVHDNTFQQNVNSAFNVCEANFAGSGTPSNNVVGPNYGNPGTTGRYSIIGAGSSAIGPEAPGIAFTPAITCGAGSGSASGRYKRIEKWIDFTVSITNCSSAGTTTLTLPANAVLNVVFAGRDTTNGNMLQGIMNTGASAVSILTSVNANPTAGDNLVVTGRYETQ